MDSATSPDALADPIRKGRGGGVAVAWMVTGPGRDQASPHLSGKPPGGPRSLRVAALGALLILLPAARMAHAAGSLCNTPSASGCAGATALPVFNPTHYAVQVGTTITSKILGATDLLGTETCTGGGAGV